MDTGIWNFICNQGATFYVPISWADENLDPIDLTGYEIRMRVKTSKSASVSIIELTTGNGRAELTDAENGEFLLQIDDADTEVLEAGRYRYDLELEAPGGFVTRLLQGRFRVRAEITT